MPESKPPHHTFELTVRVGACDWRRVVEDLQRLTDHVAEHGPQCSMVTGGAYVDVRHDPTVTEEQYRADLAAWCAADRAKREAQESGNG